MILPMVALLALACAAAAVDWRRGLFLCVLIGIAQDPLRKITPGQPTYYVVLVGVVFGVAWLSAYSRNVKLSPMAIEGWRREVKQPFYALAALILLQAAHSLFTFRSISVTGIGLLVWLAPFPAIVLAYQYALRRGMAGVRSWMRFYIFAALLSLGGVYLQYAGVQWKVLGEVGAGLVIYDLGTVLKAHSGFFRSSEIAAWHTAAIACFLFTLAIGTRVTLPRIAGALVLIALLVSLGLLTGRRKMLVEITMFLSIYLFLFCWLKRGAAKLAITLLVLGFVAYLGIVGYVAPDASDRPKTKISNLPTDAAQRISGYAERGKSVFAAVPERANLLGVQAVVWAVQDYGIMGSGLGTGSQGTDDVAALRSMRRGAAEGGFGKIAMELGVPGLFIIPWLLYALGRFMLGQLQMMTRISPQHARMSYGLVAFLLANAATFAVATQAYNDLFALLVLGWSVGFLFAMPRLAAEGEPGQARASAPATAPTAQHWGELALRPRAVPSNPGARG